MQTVKLRLHPEVAQALRQQAAVVALESTVVTHGLPRPQNLELAQGLEATIREAGAIPATVAILEGDLCIGLDDDALAWLANSQADKASLWNLAALCAQQRTAGTTVATTLHAAHLAGIRVFATGGIGGVHNEAFDESSDLTALSQYPVITVCAGPKSILNQGGTLERLETLGVPVIGYQTNKLAGFHTPQTSLTVAISADSPEGIASIYLAQQALGLKQGLLVAKPVSEGIPAATLRGWLNDAHEQAAQGRLSGKDVTPFLLAKLAELSDGKTVEVNLRLLRENAHLAAQIAKSLSAGDKA